jgi:hypothetical protein
MLAFEREAGMRLHALLLALCVAACGQTGEKAKAPEAPAAIEPFDLHIEIGRYGAMLNQVEEHTRARPGTGEVDPAQPHQLARSLRETVWEYNLARSQLCAKGLFSDVACGPAYEPVWISEPASAEPSLQDLQVRANALGDEVMRLWNAVCADARSRVEDEQEKMYVCPME